MKIAWKQLYHLPVETELGDKLGIVSGVTVDIDTHNISKYEIKSGKLFPKSFLISPDMIVSITSKKMIVKDLVIPVTNSPLPEKTRLASADSPTGVNMSSE